MGARVEGLALRVVQAARCCSTRRRRLELYIIRFCNAVLRICNVQQQRCIALRLHQRPNTRTHEEYFAGSLTETMRSRNCTVQS
jgi:hypothetical protein